jgi:hypothetical protein
MRCQLLLAVMTSILTQTQPDFSGRWILESPGSTADAVRTIVVEQPVTRTNVRGEPMTPAFLQLSVRRERVTGTSEETHQIGIVGGVVGGVVGGTGASQHWTTRHETSWVGDTLVFRTINFDGNEPRAGDWSERLERWSLAPAGHLRIEIVTESRAQPTETKVFLYRRE